MKKIFHLFSDRSHSALWSRYLRMLTLIALFAFGSHGVWGQETATPIETWTPTSESSNLTGNVHSGTKMSIDLAGSWQSIYVIDRYAIKKMDKDATYPDPLLKDYFTIAELNNNLSGKSYIKIKANKTGTIKVKGLYGVSSYKIVVGRSEYDNGAVKFFDDPIQETLVKGTPTEFEFMVFENRYYYVFVPEGGDAIFQEIKFFAAHGNNVKLAEIINNGVVTLEVAYPYIANTTITQGNTAQCVDGYDITINPQPNAGYVYRCTKVSADDGSVADKYFYSSFVITKDKLKEFEGKNITFTPEFVKGIKVSALAEVGGTAKYSLNNSDQENGSLQKPDQDFVFTATPYKGYTFSGWYNGSTLVSSDITYTASNVTADLTLTAKFEATAINEKRTITVDGKERTYWIYAPGSVNGKTNVPVIFSLHGRQNDGADPSKTDAPKFKDIADTKGVIIVYPQGRHATDTGYPNRTENGKEVAWNSGYAGNNYGWEATGQENADTKFIQALVNEIKNTKFYNNSTTVDPKRFYLCGFSMGGMMTYAIATALNDKKLFAAYASAGGFPVNEFHLNLATTMPVPFYHVHGKGDDIVIYDYLRVIKENMLARYGRSLKYIKPETLGYDHYKYRDIDASEQEVYSFNDLEYVEINDHGHSVHGQTPGGMWDFFQNYTTDIYKSYSDAKTPEWSWDMTTINDDLSKETGHTEGHSVHGWSHYTNNTSDTSMPQRYLSYGKKNGEGNVYPAIQLQAGKHIIYAKYSMAPSEQKAYLTLKNNISGVEIVARKLKNNSGSSSKTDKVIAYEFETGANGEFSVYVGRDEVNTSCTSLSIYKSPTTAVTEADESIDNSKIDITGHLLKIDFEELKRNSSDTKGTKTAELLASGNYGISCAQPSSGYAYYYANRLERKNANHHYDVVTNDKVFGNYFQNMPHADIYERTSGEDFMRIMIPEGTLSTVAEKGTITIGFWVNGNLAVDRGLSYCQQSMFYLAGDKFNGWNTDHPDDVKSEEYNAYMFNITCNGGISGYMRYVENGTTKVAAYAGGTAFGGFCDTEIDAFYKKNHYMDGNWHYITFQMYDNLSRYNMYLDGLPATLGGYSPSDKPEVLKKGISGLKSIVLGGLNARNSEWSYDVAFAYDDIVIYDRVLSQAEIKKIISVKKYTPSWNFKRNLSNANLFDAGKIKKSSIWTPEGDGVYSLNMTLSSKASLTYDLNEEIPAFRGLSFTTTANNQIKIDTSNGTLNVSSGAAVCFKNIQQDNYLRFTTKSTFANDYSEISLSGVHDKFLECPVTLFKAGEKSTGSGYNGNPTITMKNDVVIYSILRTDKQFAQMWCEDKDGKITKTYSYNSSTPATNNTEETSMIQLTDLPKINLFVNGTKRDLPSPDWKFKYSSSAPQVAKVDQNKGYVTITGIPGSAVITVELVNEDDKNETVHGNDALYERTDRIFASYEIINKREDATFVVNKGTEYSKNDSFTLTETTDGVPKTTVSVTLGGWKYGTKYQGQEDAYKAAEELSGVDCFGFSDITTENERFTEIFGNGKSISTNGTYAAKSESWVKDVNESGLYKPNEANTITNNTTPWTIPCRGTHIKVEPEYPGIMSVYVLQKGCVTERDGDNKPISVNLNQVYITDETGKSIREVICDTKTRVADQIWKNDGRARAEYTYNAEKYAITPEIFNSFRNNIEEKQRWAFLDNWDNPGMTGHVFCTDYYDDKRGVGIEGHVLISTGIVKYTFNVVPGKTYYIFSNNSPLGFAGFSFDKNKHLNIVEVQGRKYSYLVANNNNPTESKKMASDITISNDDVSPLASSVCSSEESLPYYDEITQSSKGDSKIKKYVPGTMAKITYNRAFTEGVWSSICLPYSISNRQMEEQFGEGTQVVLLNKIYDKDGHGIVQFIWHANQDIIAGYPYLILPSKTTSQIVTNSTIELKDNPLFSVTEGQKTIAYDNSDSESGYVFKGNFTEEQIPVGSYVLNTSGKLARVGVEGLKLKPFRAYLRNNAGTQAKALTTMAFSGWDDIDDLDNTTSIDEILEESGIFTKGANVYDLNGVLVRKNTHTIQGLPKGIYIVNGKKYVVK